MATRIEPRTDVKPSPPIDPGRRFADPKDVLEFAETLERFERAEIGPDAFRVFRLTRGVYGQRQHDQSMMRVKIPQGVLSAPQLRRLADVAEKYSRGFGHVTTRQNIQFHFMALDDVPKAMAELEEVGVTTREACGNTVRNVVACPLAGVCPDEVFDVTGTGEAITRLFLRNAICQALPRKFKIALSGCPGDCAMAAIHDIGLVARLHAGNGTAREGFLLRVGGGLSTQATEAAILDGFVPREEALEACLAVVRAFDRLGDRKNKAHARLKFVIKRIGIEAFRLEYEVERAAIRAARDAPAESGGAWSGGERHAEAWSEGGGNGGGGSGDAGNGNGGNGEAASAGAGPAARYASTLERISAGAGPGFARWARTNVKRQRQEGYAAVFVTLPLGDVSAAQLRALAGLAERYSDGTVRTAQDQNVVLRWIYLGEIPSLFEALTAAGLGGPEAGRLVDPTSCPGAESCKLAVTASRDLARALADRFRNANGAAEAVEAAGALRIKISGCPNGCGQHHVAGIGFYGSAKKIGDRLVPHYQLLLGGGVDADGARFGRRIAKIPAGRVPEATTRLLELYRKERAVGEEPLDFFRRVPDERVLEALRDGLDLAPEDLRPDDLRDLGSDEDYRVFIQEGECAT